MFSRVEQTKAKNLVIEKFAACKQAFEKHSSSQNLSYRFLFDVLKDILDEVSKCPSFFYPSHQIQLDTDEHFQFVRVLVNAIEEQVVKDLNSYRMFRDQVLDLSLEIFMLGVVGLQLHAGVSLILMYAVGNAANMAKIIMITYFSAGFLAFIVAITLSVALYCYIGERQCQMQLAQLRGLVNRLMSYNREDFTELPDPESFNFEGQAGHGNLSKSEFLIDEENPNVVHIKVKFSSVSLLFWKYSQSFQTMMDAEPNDMVSLGGGSLKSSHNRV